ncbi:MAG TPA: hypothetical protein VGN26_00215 [Armatimonadota bacterium]|jgi:hypothetical protein
MVRLGLVALLCAATGAAIASPVGGGPGVPVPEPMTALGALPMLVPFVLLLKRRK